MKTNLLKHVHKVWPDGSAPRSIVRHNRRAWVKSVRYLGPKWLLAVPVQKTTV